jgi:hypothetical protein
MEFNMLIDGGQEVKRDDKGYGSGSKVRATIAEM